MEHSADTLDMSPPRRLGRRAEIVLGTVAALACGALVALHLVLLGEVLPATSVEGTPVGGLGRADLQTKLAEALRARSERAVTLTYGGRQRLVKPQELGYAIDVEATAERAMAQGRAGGLISDLRADVTSVAGARRAVEPAEEVDRAKLGSLVDSLEQATERVPTTGSIEVRDDLSVVPKLPRRGIELRRADTVERILAAFQSGTTTTVDAAIVFVEPPVEAGDVRRTAREAERYLRRPLKLRGGGTKVAFRPRRFARLLTLRRASADGERTAQLGIDRAKLLGLVRGAKRQIDRPSAGARVDPKEPLPAFAEPNDVTWSPQRARVRVSPARPGRDLNVAETAAKTAAAILDGDHEVHAALKLTPPSFGTAAARRVDRVIGAFTTFHACCEPRVENIHRVADIVDGTVILPGKDFSLNRAAGGERTLERGFVPAPTIIDGEVVDTVGGGLSQFSTTTYNAAYFAGLQINYHKPHSFYISRYPIGREATVNWPNVDLHWTNDTETPIVVRTSYTETSITVALYGRNGGRVVSAEAGSTQPWPEGAFKLTVTREIRYRNGRTKREPYTTFYAEATH